MYCLSVAGYAQTAASYGLTATTGSYNSISATGTPVSSGGMISDNGVTTSIPIGFNFVYCGTTYTSSSASANGWFSLANSALGAAPSQTNATGSLSSIGSGAGLLMPLWADLYGVSQTAYYQTTGTAGSRVFVMEWKNWSVCCAAGLATLNFQVKLYEGTNTIEYWYGFNSGTIPSTATVGICNSTSDFQTLPLGTSTFTNTSFNSTCAPPANGVILRWCPQAPAISGGTSSFCASTTITLTDALAGGTWSSSTPSVATVNSSTGVVTGVTAGTATINYTPACGPAASKVVTVTATPTTFSVTGGGAYCAGGTGVLIGLDGSTSGVVDSLFNGATYVTNVTGTVTGAPISFGLQTASGTYTVKANNGSCSATMLSSATVSVNALPTAFAVTGGGAYCLGGAGSAIGLSSSTIGVNYQLYLGTTPVGSPVVGSGGTISFGLQTTAGTTYNVVATNATTLCSQAMTGSATVSITALPGSFSVTGGGNYCLGSAANPIGLSGSASGVNYQLQVGGVPVTTLSGTGGVLNFGSQSAVGTYTVLATNPTTTCTVNMSGSTTVTINPLPVAYTVIDSPTSGAYCLGGTGVKVSLNNSQLGVNYQLYNGATPVGSPVAGTGVAISFGFQTTVGSYTVVGTNATTACVNNMFGSISISNLPLPAVFTVTGGGGYCAGAAGVPVGLASSSAGVNYQLYNGTTLIGAASGTGSAISFGNMTAAGSYTVVATNISTSCTSNMSGSTTVTINPLPAAFNVTEAGTGSYCAGGAGVAIGLSNSATGVNYQLYNGVTPVGSVVPGSTGSIITFGPQTAAGSYTAVATQTYTVPTTSTCTNNMNGSAVVTINPLPTVYTMTGASGFCGGGGTTILGLSASNTGISYQLYSGSAIVGALIPGTGSALTFGPEPAGTYTVSATNTTTTCFAGMSGSITVSVNALPTAYTVTGTNSFCAGGTGLNVYLGGSATGISYQLYNGTALVGLPVAGTGSPLVFGPVTVGGTYTVVATNTTTGCSSNMLSSAIITVNPLPSVFSVTGGGTYCSGTGGGLVGLSSSVTGTNYQIFKSGVGGVTMAGTTGLALNFGSQTTGTYTIVATTTLGSCQANMSGTANVSVNPLPATFTVGGGGNYCAGGTGKDISLGGSAIGFNYQLMNGSTPVGTPRSGTGSSIDFGLQTAAGAYTVVATNSSTGCFAPMTGTATITITPLPTADTVTGGGSYCSGTGGVPVGLNSSSTGVNYKLYNGAAFVDSVAGSTPLPIPFGLQTTPGIYTVIASNPATGCSSNMIGSVTVGIYPLPVVYNVTGGGNYCFNGTGVNVGNSGSNIGVSYQLMLDAAPAGAAITGTGLPLNFGLQSDSGSYTIVATNTTTMCSDNMHGTAHVGINALPNDHNVTGGGNYCVGGTGIHIGLNGSDAGTDYQLVIGGSMPVGTLVAGTGSTIDFGSETGIGTYTIIATNTATTCTDTMIGSAIVDTNSLPAVYAVSGGGAYCAGGTGLAITLSNSDATATYQLYNGAATVGSPVAGLSSGLTFGPETAAGTYSIIATNDANPCTSVMAGTVTISVNPLPVKYIVSGGGNYCAGGTGVNVYLSGSNSGIAYQLLVGGIASGPVVAGTGMGLTFGPATAAGVAKVIATNMATGCVDTMNGSVTIGVNPLPPIHTVVSPFSSFCAGGSGVAVYIDGSNTGINYQLYNGTTTVGLPKPGTGDSINFGSLTLAGNYEILATNTATGCVDSMMPGVTVTIFPLPTVYAVTGGGQYCSGGAGDHIGLSGSATGVTYKLYTSGSTFAVDSANGTGSAIDFGLHTAAGTYTVVADNPTTTCTNNMSGVATVVINPLPTGHTVTGGGNYCAGGTGSVIGLNGSTLGITYQLMLGGAPVGGSVTGTGSAITFGPQTGSGTYTVMGTSTITGCSATMAGSAVIGINPLPSAFSVTGGGNFCPGGTGVNIGVSGSNTGVTYKLYNGSTLAGTLAGTGSAINFGLETTAGAYTVIASNNTTGCTNTMSGIANVIIDPLPTVYTVVGGGNYCAGGAGVHVGLSGSVIGVNYTLYAGISTILTLPGTGAALDFGLQTIAGTYTVLATNAATGCSQDMSGSVTVVINTVVTPSVTIATSTGSDTVCEGNLITFTADPVNGGGTPSYVWTVNGTTVSTGGSIYGYSPSNGDVLEVTLTSDALCALPSTISTSITMTVDPKQSPFVNVSADPGTEVCLGTSVTFVPAPSFGGSSPAYQWFVDGVNTGSTASTYTYTPAVGDYVYVLMTSNYLCRLANTANSSHVNMTVDIPTLPVVTIAANPGEYIANGETTTLTATVANGGASPTFEWLLNGTPVAGATNATFTSSTFVDKDSVTCLVTSSGACSGLVGFNSVTMHVSNVGVQSVTSTGSNILLIPNPNNGTFTVKGSLGSVTDEDVTLEVVNMLGQVIYNQKAAVHNGEINEHVQLNSSLANGMYLLNVHSGSGNEVFHFVIEQ